MDVITYNNKESVIKEIKRLGKAIYEQRKELLVPYREFIPKNDIVDAKLLDIKYVVNDDSKIIFVGENNKIIDFDSINTFLLVEILRHLGIDGLDRFMRAWDGQGGPVGIAMMKFLIKEGVTEIGDTEYLTRKGDKITFFNGKELVPIEEIPFFILVIIFRVLLIDNDDYNTIEELYYFR